MPTHEQALAVLARYEQGEHPTRKAYEEASRVLGVPPGQLFMIATGLAADGGDTYPEWELRRPGMLPTSTQHIVYGHMETRNPTEKATALSWVKATAHADLQMQAAAASRDAAPGEPLEPEDTDIATILTRDHDQVTAMMEELKTIPGVTKGGSPVQLSRRKSLVDMITVALSQHEATEEEHFWPAVRETLPDGDERAETALEQEQEGKDILTRLGKLEASEQEFDHLAEELDKAARKHVAFEDRVLLALHDQMGEGERYELGRRFREAERHAPTRPHRHSPKRPAAAVKAAGAAAAALDHARDRLGDRPAARRGKAEEEPERLRRAGEQVSAAEVGIGPGSKQMQRSAEERLHGERPAGGSEPLAEEAEEAEEGENDA